MAKIKIEYQLSDYVKSTLEAVTAPIKGEEHAQAAVDAHRSAFLHGMCAQIGGVWPPPLATESEDGSYTLIVGTTAAMRALVAPVIADTIRKPFRSACTDYLGGYGNPRVASAAISRWIRWGLSAGCFAWKESAQDNDQAAIDCEQIVTQAKALASTKGKSVELILRDQFRLNAWAMHLVASVDMAVDWRTADLRAEQEEAEQAQAEQADRVRTDAFEAGKHAAIAALPQHLQDLIAQHGTEPGDQDDPDADTPARRRRRA